jgi:cell division protease FtsH
MTMDNPDEPVILEQSNYGPGDVRYSDFLKLVQHDRIEKVAFTADGTQLLGMDVDGVRIRIAALPDDPDLLTQLTTHKVIDSPLVYINIVLSDLLTFY